MPDTKNLHAAKRAKYDEFYTRYSDIEAEMGSYIEFNPEVFKGKTILLPCDDPDRSNFTKYFLDNFERFQLKRLISTSISAPEGERQLSLFSENCQWNTTECEERGKMLIRTRDREWHRFLKGNGDFRSEEVREFRDEADVIITNPPFTLFGDFLEWTVSSKKQFSIIGSLCAVAYKNVFPLLKDNKMWFGNSIHSGDRKFNIPDSFHGHIDSTGVDKEGKYARVCVRWYTNIEHGGRRRELKLETCAHNLQLNKKLKEKLLKCYGKAEFQRYDNYDAIDVPFVECIPSDYDGMMGVPVSFMDKYNPDQFEIVWVAAGNTSAWAPKEVLEEMHYFKSSEDKGGCSMIQGKRTYNRIIIRKKGDKRNYGAC